MKPLYTFAAALLLATATLGTAAAHPRPANLTVFSEQGQPFGMALDGRNLTSPLARQVHVDLLVPGRHWADITLTTPGGRPLYLHQPVWLQPGRDCSYMVVLRPYGAELQEVQQTPAGYPTGPVYPGGQGYYPNGTGGSYYPNNGGNGSYYPGNDSGSYYPNGGSNGGYYPGSDGSYPAPGGPAYPAPAPGTGGYYPGSTTTTYLQPLLPADLSNLRQSLGQKPFEDDRLSIARQALAQRSLSTEDLKALISQFSFEKSRVALAEFGYPHLSDPQNFYQVYDTFQFSTSMQEVQQALNLPRN